jgi:dihydrofolate reductase
VSEEGGVRRVIYSMMVSLDGFIARPGGELDWVLIDDELHTFVNDQARHLGGSLYGRGMWELMAASWPTADQDPKAPAYIFDFARIWRAMPKIVFSRTLDRVDENARLVRTDAADEISRLKAEPGGDLWIGGADLAATAIRRGLVDEYRLFVNQVVLGAGKPMFPPTDAPIGLRLLETRRFDSGVVYSSYQALGVTV